MGNRGVMQTRKRWDLAVLRETWLNHLWIDVVVAAGLLALHMALVSIFGVADILGDAAPQDRRAVYTSAAVVVSLLASFSGIAIGQLSAAKGDRATSLKVQVSRDLARNWSSIFRAGLLAALIAVLALLLDPSTQITTATPVVVRWAFELALLISVVKFLRASALFQDVMEISAMDAGEKEVTTRPAPEISPRWRNVS